MKAICFWALFVLLVFLVPSIRRWWRAHRVDPEDWEFSRDPTERKRSWYE